MNEEVDFDEILEEFRNGKKLTGKGGLLAPLIKQLTEAAFEAEVELHIANDVLSGNRNRRNGINKKTIKDTSNGTFELETPHDRNGTFELICQPYIILINKYFKQLFHFVTSFFLETPQEINCCLNYASCL